MAHYVARIELVNVTNNTKYDDLHKAMKGIGYLLKPGGANFPRAEYENLTGPNNLTIDQVAGMVRLIVERVHKPSKGVITRGEVSSW